MKIISLAFIILCYSLSNVRAEVSQNQQVSASAIWYKKTKLRLNLPGNLNVNETLFYSLHNTSQSKDIPLSPILSHDRVVEFSLPNFTKKEIDELIIGNLRVIAKRRDGSIIYETSIQMAGLLDELYYYPNNDLGISFLNNKINLKIWAPTATMVQLNLYQNEQSSDPSIKVNMQREDSGVWHAEVGAEFKNYYYTYSINLFNPFINSFVSNEVTDPYSISLSMNSARSQLIDINDPQLQPPGFKNLIKINKKNKVIYETHIRDLTSYDDGIPEKFRGKFLALTNKNGKAYKHLKELSDSGLTHVHFLPLNDFATVDEDERNRVDIDKDLKIEAGNSELPQSELNRLRHLDSYNWGYDPYHYLVPEGSYAMNPNGTSRIYELRSMIKSLNEIGLKTIVDVVFNHTYSSGVDRFSVLNKIVPFYYYRYDEFGNVANSSCCSDTASEHKMMEKLMIDAVVFWAKNYKIDGFRFDLMSFHTKDNLRNIRKALDNLTLANDGVDGKSIYLYGEGWSFGSLFERRPDLSMNQLNAFGEGVGFFNDRFRDAIRGGTTDSKEKSDQGFVTGLFTDFNFEIANRDTPTNLYDQKNKLNVLKDVVKIGLAGNLRDYVYRNFVGDEIKASQFYFRGVPTAYAATTDETINYVSAHDGYTLWDAVNAKAPFYAYSRNPGLASTFEKQRMTYLALGLTLLSQGIPFIEGGSEILRSKSGDVDGYDSGDWFNHISFDFDDNNWGKGVPPSFKNFNDWSFWSPRLADPNMKPTSLDVENNLKLFKALLKVRKNSTLFANKDTKEAMRVVKFIHSEIDETGIISLHLKNQSEELLIFFNVNKADKHFKNNILLKDYKMHPELNEKQDALLKRVQINGNQILIPERSIVILIPVKK